MFKILNTDDKVLNQWVSVKKASQYRSEKDEEYDRKAYEQKVLSGKKEKLFSKKLVYLLPLLAFIYAF